MNKEKFLPIGTIVKLKEGTGYSMIVGFLVQKRDPNDTKIYDYLGCVYPFGIMDPNYNLMYNHEDIVEVVHEGYIDDNWKEFNIKMNEELKNINSGQENV